MTTTTELLAKRSYLKFYESLEIKRRFGNSYEAEWLDVTKYLMDASTEIETRLDFESYGYGEVKSGTAKFLLNNKNGKFNPAGTLYSLFESATSRHFTRLRYKAGYYDESGDKIDETVFEGLLNEKSIDDNFNEGYLSITAQNYSQILSQQSSINGSLLASMTAKNVIIQIMANAEVNKFVTCPIENVNPDKNITFNDAVKFENKKVSEILTDICQKTNSIWYVNQAHELVITGRMPNANTPHRFIGGSQQRRNTNILTITSYDSGFTKIINDVVYKSGDNTFSIRPDIESTITNGVQTLNLEGDDLTDELVITNIANAIISEWKRPRIRVVLSTPYSPNIYNLFDLCTIDFKPSTKDFLSKPTLIFNQGMNFNDGNYFGVYKDQFIVKPSKYFVYYGFSHNPAEGTTQHYLIEK